MITDSQLEKGLKDFYAAERQGEQGPDCPTQLELSDYLEKRLNSDREERVLEHISACARCLSLIELARRAEQQQMVFPAPSPQMVNRAKKTASAASVKKGSQYKWLMFAAAPFALSFVFPRYFWQFLIATVILGLKWVFDTAASRTLIMVYEAWRGKDRDFFQKDQPRNFQNHNL